MAEPTSSEPAEDLVRIRQALMRQLESVNTYEGMARQAATPEAQAALANLAQRAKEDVAALTRSLTGLDAGQAAAFAASGLETPRPAAPAAAARPPAIKPASAAPSRSGLEEDLRLPAEPEHILHALPAPPSPLAGQFSVGPLRGQKL